MQMIRFRPSLLMFVPLALAVAAAGCASSASKAPEAPAAEQPGGFERETDEAPTSVGGAAAELDRAEQQLLAALGSDEDRPDGEPLSPYAEPPAAPAEEPGAQPPRPYRAEGYGAAERDRCGIACRALGSMRRAAARLCSIAGEDDARCERAERRVAHASDLVRRSCSPCG